MADKRRAGVDIAEDVLTFPPDEPSAAHVTKQRRLADDRVASHPQGANLIECDGKSCTHEVAWPPGSAHATTLPPPAIQGPPARTYPFKIDPFQQTAVNALEAGNASTLRPIDECLKGGPWPRD